MIIGPYFIDAQGADPRRLAQGHARPHHRRGAAPHGSRQQGLFRHHGTRVLRGRRPQPRGQGAQQGRATSAARPSCRAATARAATRARAGWSSPTTARAACWPNGTAPSRWPRPAPGPSSIATSTPTSPGRAASTVRRTTTRPLWAIGWDARSVLLNVRDGGRWTRFRLPKASHTQDADHGWYTEWPRIREVGGGHFLMNMHDMFYDLPKTFRPARRPASGRSRRF